MTIETPTLDENTRRYLDGEISADEFFAVVEIEAREIGAAMVRRRMAELRQTRKIRN